MRLNVINHKIIIMLLQFNPACFFKLCVNGNAMFYATIREKSNKYIYIKMRIYLLVKCSVKRIICLPYSLDLPK